MGKVMKGKTVTHCLLDEYVPESGQRPSVGRLKPPTPVTTLPKIPPPAAHSTYYISQSQYDRWLEQGYIG